MPRGRDAITNPDRHLNPDQGLGVGHNAMDYVEAKTAWVLGQKALTDLKVAEKSGKLTDAELVAREVEQIFRELCQRFRTVADRLPFDHQQRESLLREMDSIQGEYARELGID